MRGFTSARYTVPLGHHSYPMDKYRLVPARLLAEGTLTQDEMGEPEAATLDDVLRVHTPAYVHAFINGTLERKAMLRIGLPWSPELVRRPREADAEHRLALQGAVDKRVYVRWRMDTQYIVQSRSLGFAHLVLRERSLGEE